MLFLLDALEQRQGGPKNWLRNNMSTGLLGYLAVNAITANNLT